MRAFTGAAALATVAVAVVLVANAALTGASVGRAAVTVVDPGYVPAGAPLGMIGSDPDDPDDPWSAAAPPGGVVLQTPGPSASPGAVGLLRIPAPRPIPAGPRRVGVQVGHWKTDEVPSELRRLEGQTGSNWDGLSEIDVNLEVAQRIAAILNSQGIAVDVLPTTVPAGYLADAFISLHADSDGVGEVSGFKMAHGARRGPYEETLLADVRDAYADATGLEWDTQHITRGMTGYFAFNWSRFQHAVAAHTPAIILEMGYLSSDHDRELLTEKPDVLAGAIADGLVRFLNETPRSKIFAQDLVVPGFPARPTFVPRAP